MNSSYEISTNPRRFDLSFIHGFLRRSYWAANIPRKVVERSMRHSRCFGAFCRGRQVAFARVITDRATFAYLADVFVAPRHRGRGLGKRMVRAILAHPDLQGVRRLMLATRDAHGLYAQFGFQPLPDPDKFMTLHYPGIYQKKRARPVARKRVK